MTIVYCDDIIHVGVGHDDNPPGRGSGRYGYGTGKNPMQHQFNFLSEVERLKSKGLKDKEIAEMLLGEKKKAVDLRAEIAIAKNQIKKHSISEGQEMLERCNGNISEAARRLGYKNESSLRSLLDPLKASNRTKYENTAEMLKKSVDKKGYIDISTDSNLYLGVNKNTMDTAVAMLRKEGYVQGYVSIPQMGTTHNTSVKVLAKPGTTQSDIQKNRFNVQPVIGEFTPDEGKTWWTPEFPESIDSKRVYIRYAEEGGKEKDGVIELRRGVDDISLGNSAYAQVRIAVDGTNYMKGMAIYADDSDIPKGYDVVYNTNKHVGTPAIDKNAKYVYNPSTEEWDWTGNEVMKRLKINNETMEVDKDNPFGALIKAPNDRNGIVTAAGQSHYIDKNGEKKLSVINKLQEEGDWDNWSRQLSSQFLSKQPLKLINQQIDLTLSDKKSELEDILNLTNPVIKQKLLEDFANNCDSNASNLKVRGFKNQSYRVILPVTSLKDDEVYAPGLPNGEMIALVRFPHAGIFEIPIVKNNTKHSKAKSIVGNHIDAIGINHNVADRMSGADFDGDFVIPIPMTSSNLKISHHKQLPGLEGFDPKELYKLPDSAPRIKSKTKELEMGKVSNLISDMTLQGAKPSEIERAVRHSMVVIDSEKHHLDYKQSAKDNNIRELKIIYQGSVDEQTGKIKTGAATIVSRAKNPVRIPLRKEVTNTSIMTPDELKRWNEGKKVYRNTGETKKKLITDESIMTPEEKKSYRSGKKIYRDTTELKTIEVNRMETVDDAMDLVHNPSDKKEVAYARFANELKGMANSARKEARSIKPIKVDNDAKKTYAKEVESLNTKLRIAKSNNPRERRAQMISNQIVLEKEKSNPGMDFEHLQRMRSIALTQARAMVGAKKELINITDEEWEAIQSNAINSSKLKEILNNTDQDLFKKRATPRTNKNELSDAKKSLVLSMYSSEMYSLSEIADHFGVSVSTISNILKSN